VIAFFASSHVLRLIGTPDNIIKDAVTYMQMSCIGVPMIAVYIFYRMTKKKLVFSLEFAAIYAIVAVVIHIVTTLTMMAAGYLLTRDMSQYSILYPLVAIAVSLIVPVVMSRVRIFCGEKE